MSVNKEENKIISPSLLKRVGLGLFWILLISGIAFLFAFSQKKENELLCGKVAISVLRDPMQENYLVEEENIRELIAKRFGQIENTPLKNIDINYLERLVYTNPWVERADAYLTINGVVNVEIEQRVPILRVVNEAGESYFIDAKGKPMPWSPDFTPRTLIATGHIKEKFDQCKNMNMEELINNDTLKTNTMLDDLYTMAKFILADEFWSAHVEQIYLNENDELELIPKVGDHKIIFGNSDDMVDKFWKLKTFYKEGLNYTGWENYDTLNLKFKNQVVCTKPFTKPMISKNNNTISKH